MNLLLSFSTFFMIEFLFFFFYSFFLFFFFFPGKLIVRRGHGFLLTFCSSIGLNDILNISFLFTHSIFLLSRWLPTWKFFILYFYFYFCLLPSFLPLSQLLRFSFDFKSTISLFLIFILSFISISFLTSFLLCILFIKLSLSHSSFHFIFLLFSFIFILSVSFNSFFHFIYFSNIFWFVSFFFIHFLFNSLIFFI